MKNHRTHHLVKSGDLNHHGTLFAGQMSSWFVEGCFVAAASLYKKPEGIVCLKVHGFRFYKPAQNGGILVIDTRVVKTGKTSITVYGKAVREGDASMVVDGFITFVTVDENGNKVAHDLKNPVPKDEEEEKIQNEATQLD